MWSAEYMIGNSQIDSQHKQLVLTLDGLLKALKEPPQAYQKQVFEQTVKFVKNYAVVHFNTEEMYQAEIGFTEAEAHRQMHKDFVEKVHEKELELIRSDYETAVVRQLAEFLTQWLIYHIMKEDKKMANPAYSTKPLPAQQSP